MRVDADRTRHIVQLFRNTLSETDARDIGNSFGQRVGAGIRLYDGLPGAGLDAKISSLVQRALQLNQLDQLLTVAVEWREDLKDDLGGDPRTRDGEGRRPHNLPPDGYVFGRRDEEARVLEGLSSRYPIVSINGFPGVGKTSLAIHVAYLSLRADEVPPRAARDYVVWISARDKLEQKLWLDEALNTVARVLGHPAITQRVFEAPDHKIAEINDLLQRHRVLVVVDNFDTIDDPDLIRWLHSVPDPSHVLLTSRGSPLQGAWVTPLEGLKDADAVEVIRQRARALALPFLEHQPAESLLPLVHASAGNPMVIELAVGLILEGRATLDEVVDHLRTAGDDVRRVFDYLFTNSWALMDESARTVLMTMPLFVESVTRQALTAVSDLDEQRCVAGITQLVRMNIVNVDYIALRYSIHPMTRAFATRNLAAREAYADAARHRCCVYYLQFTREHALRDRPSLPYWNALVTDRMTAIDVEWASILRALGYADENGEDALLLDLVMTLVHYMDSRFYNLERITYVRKAVDAAARLGRREVEALLRIDALGWTYVEENRLSDAEHEIRHGLALAEQLEADPQADSRSSHDLIALGNAWLARLTIEYGDAEGAEALVSVAMATPCSPWIRYRVFMAAGDIALKTGDSPRAIDAYQHALEEYDSYGGEGQGYQIDPRLGMAYASSGDLARATGKFEGLRARPHIAIGRLYGDYGAAYVAYRQGRIDEAKSLASAARTELSRRTSSNLLLEMIDKLFHDLEAPQPTRYSGRTSYPPS